jgi:hypothetical protein
VASAGTSIRPCKRLQYPSWVTSRHQKRDFLHRFDPVSGHETPLQRLSLLRKGFKLDERLIERSAISSTVLIREGLSLLGILRQVDKAQWLTTQLGGGGRGTGIEPSPRSQEWSMGPGGPLEVHDPGQNGRRLKESQTAVPGDHPASTWHWDPCQTHIEPPD